MMNQSAIDRGFFRSVFFRTYNDRESVAEKIQKPDRRYTMGLKHGPYEKLDRDGLISPGTQVHGDDIIIGKTRTPDTDKYVDGQRVLDQRMMKDAS